jgi:glycosyltransferase involved in cell wall biosynthesis
MTNHPQFDFGYNSLGPVINMYMARLHSYLRQCDGKDHKILFATRAGIRIHELYQTWLSSRNITAPANISILKSSRILSIKAAYCADKSLALTSLGQELNGLPLETIINSLLKPFLDLDKREMAFDLPSIPLHEFINQNHAVAVLTDKYLKEQSGIYKDYLKGIVGDAKRLILIDSGWKGTSQTLLESAFPEYSWEGVYFGCIGRTEILGRRAKNMHGLMFDSEKLDDSKLETAFLVHRHLIESLFEPNIPSIEHLNTADIKRTLDHNSLLNNETKEDWDRVYDGVRSYIQNVHADGIFRIECDYDIAISELSRLLCYPTSKEVALACGKLRSHDLGRDGSVSSVMPPENRFDGDSPALRIEQSIWQPGQAALEYTDEQSRVIAQQKIISRLKESTLRQYYIPSKTIKPQNNHVAIITRTKNRPLLLKRAAESVACQTHKDYTWVVVNDGGDIKEVLSVIQESQIDPTKIVICSNKESTGMEAASNIGIRNSNSEFIVIHDDDDSWHPNFLERSVGFLNGNKDIYGGVISKTTYVSEEIVDEKVVEHGRWPYNDWIKNIQIAEMAVGNLFAPIAFLFKRSFYDDIEGFDERLPVLGDWDFNLRYLMRTDIGVLPESLAFYHHRDQGNVAQTYSNSVIGGLDRHAEYNSIVRNKYIRGSHISNDYKALAVLMGTAFNQADIRHRLDSTNQYLIANDPSKAQSNRHTDNLQWENDNRWVALQTISSRVVPVEGASTRDRLLEIYSNLDYYIMSQKLETPPDFDTDEYLRNNNDVKDAINSGILFSGFDHYMKYGRQEGRGRPNIDIDVIGAQS